MLIKQIVLAAATLTALSAPSLAADPNFCAEYARDAVRQVEVNMATPGCFRGFDARWNRDYGVHYGWCLGASYEAANGERALRAHRLRECRLGY
ncbi:MAG: hypothetical protein E7774_13570 [Bradyrhizobium sp.]|nr:MAG: hypothetical protein E7774_13570 [Bradyrhizobium sp.]